MTSSPENHDPDDREAAGNSLSTRGKTRAVLKVGVLLVLVAIAGFAIQKSGNELTLSGLAARETAYREFQHDQPVLVLFLAIALYIVVAGLSLPGAVPLTLMLGWLLGFWQGLIAVSFGSTAGATVAFLLSRYLFRDSIERRFGSRLSTFNQSLEKDGAFYLFTLRLIPAVPFFVINAVMGVTPIRARTFWWISQLGMLPGTVVYVYAGASVPRLQVLADQGISAVFTPAHLSQIAMAFGMLGLLPLLIRIIMNRIARFRGATKTSTSESIRTESQP